MDPILVLLCSLFIVLLIGGVTLLDAVADLLNVRKMRKELPEEFREIYDEEKYKTSLQYQKDNVRVELFKNALFTIVTLVFALGGGFNWVDHLSRSWGLSEIASGLIFVATLSVLRFLMHLPFSIHHTFVIEEKFGFNRTTPKTFIGDILKGLILGVVLGAPIFAGIQWFFQAQGANAWWICWVTFTALQILLVFIAPVVLMPLFNRFNPLPEGALKHSIENYARAQKFRIQGVFTMDGSKRSTKANAYFTGFGPFRRLVLFDTLISTQTPEELTAVVAHEIGHFKCKHIPKSMGLSVLVSGGMFYLFSLLMENRVLFEVFRMDSLSIYASLVFVSFLFSPVMRIASIFTHWLSRKFEFEADEYSARTYGKPDELITALKKLSISNLSNLTPHPLKIWLDYTHPPVLQRISHLRDLGIPHA